jgi:GT2 family glycosyltransferase
VNTRKSVSIIIANYNGKLLLSEYLPYTYAAINSTGAIYEIIIVDDCSTDDSVQFIRLAYPPIKIIVNAEKKGFSFSYNRGIAVAQYELILLLSADVKLSPGYFEHQWKYFLRWDTFGTMGRITHIDSDHILEAARLPKYSGYRLTTECLYYSNDENDRLRTFYLSGANALVSAEKLKRMGGFNELFPAYYGGDMELSLRAWRLKWKCYYEHRAICSQRLPDCSKNYEYYISKYFLHAIHLNGTQLKAWYLRVAITDLIPKLLRGKTGVWKSYRAVLNNKALIKHEKEQFWKLMDENDSKLSAPDVVNNIRATVQNKNIFRFKARCN